jgi:large subunit ribosomal protein L30
VIELSQQKTATVQAQEEVKSGLLVVNLRGMVNTRAPVRTTLDQMRIGRRFNATIVPDDKVHRGMLHLSKEHVAWCKLDAATAEKLLKARSEKSSGKRTPESEIKTEEYGSIGEIASALASGKLKLRSIETIRPFFRLSPPRGGFKRSSVRQFSAGGVLGPNSELPKLLEKML